MRPKKVILCVDDNDQALSVRKFVLETRGYRVLTAKNAAEAIELYDRGRVDLVITDLVMPHCNGNDLIHAIEGNCAVGAGCAGQRQHQAI